MAPILEAEDLVKNCGRFPALKGISFTVEERDGCFQETFRSQAQDRPGAPRSRPLPDL